MSMTIDSLKFAIGKAEATVSEAEQKGVEGGQARFDLGAAKDNLTRVRSVIHTFDVSRVEEITTKGIKIADDVNTRASEALGDIKLRRIGLAISLLVIIFIAIMLRLKIKQVDSRTNFEAGHKSE